MTKYNNKDGIGILSLFLLFKRILYLAYYKFSTFAPKFIVLQTKI